MVNSARRLPTAGLLGLLGLLIQAIAGVALPLDATAPRRSRAPEPLTVDAIMRGPLLVGYPPSEYKRILKLFDRHLRDVEAGS